MRIPRCSVLFAALTLVSCPGPKVYKNADASTPHAVLHETEYPNAGYVRASYVNGQPTSFWRISDVFHIPTGPTTCDTAFSDRKETVIYKTLQFVAVAGSDYVITRKREPDCVSPFTATPQPTVARSWVIHDRRDRVEIRETKPDGSDTLVADAPRESSVFNVESSAEALSEYRIKHP